MKKNIVVLEKRRKIAEINGENFFVWELFDVLKLSQLKEWCQDRGYGVPYLSDVVEKASLSVDLEASLWDVDSKRA